MFDEMSGQTHQLDPLRAFVLNALASEAMTANTILNELLAVPSIAGNSELPILVQTLLDEFTTMGLVEATEN